MRSYCSFFRRGSNASLTIDLNPVETLHLATPPKEWYVDYVRCMRLALVLKARDNSSRTAMDAQKSGVFQDEPRGSLESLGEHGVRRVCGGVYLTENETRMMKEEPRQELDGTIFGVALFAISPQCAKGKVCIAAKIALTRARVQDQKAALSSTECLSSHVNRLKFSKQITWGRQVSSH